MPNNWKKYKLGEIAELTMGISPKGNDVSNDMIGLPLLNGPTEFGYSHPTPKQYTRDPKKISEIGDLLFCVRGSTTGKMNFSNQQYAIGRGIGAFKGINGYSTKYVKYLIDFYLEKLLSVTTGSTFPNLSKKDLLDFNIVSCNSETANEIASILSVIDDKIENNLAINKTLEEMAIALYKHWFVDFGPFQDGEFVESELGMIPKGWEVKKLDDLIDVVSKGTTPRMKDVAGLEIKIPFLKVKDVNTDGDINTNNIDLIPEEIHLKDLKRSILYENDLLFSIAGTIGRVSIVTKYLDNSNCNQALAFIRLKDKETFKSFIYYWLKSDEIQNRIQNSVVQGVQANVSLTVLKDLKLPISAEYRIIEEYSEKANPILELILQNQEQNRLLKTNRETLLPQLISGTVRLKEFRETVEEVL